jgi:hypothetical protein
MRSIVTLGLAAGVAGLLFLPVQTLSQEKKEKPAYIGVEACGKCHKRESTGNQLGQWQQTKHAQAYATLASEEAKKIAKEKGIADPQKDGKCLKCHVTAYGVDPSLIVADKEGKPGVRLEDGVGCESCHGAGSLYKSRKIMKDRQASLANGLVIPDEKTCTTCHNEESPNYQEFKFEEMVEKVKHPNPKKGMDEGESEE